MNSFYLSPLNYTLPPTHTTALTQIDAQFHLSTTKLKSILKQFLLEFNGGLACDPTENKPFMPMIPTFVQSIPHGQETGTFLALDLGGTNLRVCEVVLLGDKKWSMKQQKYRVSTQLKEGKATALFDYIAASVDQFLTEIGTTATQDHLYLGFTFSFPVAQTAINAGTLINWTKGFKCTGAIGEDVVQLLQQALDRKHIHVKVVALVNDTAGTLMARAYEIGSDKVLCGGIFGTGTNGAYVEDVKNVVKGEGKGERMIINTEWGAFDNEVSPFTS